MNRTFGSILAVGALAAALGVGFAPARAQEKGEKVKLAQSEAASKTEQYKTVAKTDKAYKDAHASTDLAGALKLVDKPATFKGTVVKLFEPKGRTMVILNFAADYKTAITAVLRKSDFAAFPDVAALQDKEVLVSGKVTTYQDRPQIELTKPDQIKLVK